MEQPLINIYENIHKLTPGQKPVWGKMTPQHMVEHLYLAVKFSYGKLKVSCSTPEDKLPVMKRFLKSDKPLPQNFVSPVFGESLTQLIFPSIEISKQKLLDEINSYYKFYEQNPDAKSMNPTFGELNFEEWEIFHRKHFTHHFTQFSLL